MVCCFGVCLPTWQLIPLITLVAYQVVSFFARQCSRRPLEMKPLSAARARALVVRMLQAKAPGLFTTLVANATSASSSALPSVPALHITSADDYRALVKLTTIDPEAVVLVKVGAYWCPPCRAIAPAVDAVGVAVHKQGLAAVAAALAALPAGSVTTERYSDAAADALLPIVPTPALKPPAKDECEVVCEGGVCEMRKKKPAATSATTADSAPAATAASASASADADADENENAEDEGLLAERARAAAAAAAAAEAAEISAHLAAPLPRFLIADVDVARVQGLDSLASVLPTFLVIAKGTTVDSFRGANPSTLVYTVQKHMFVDCRSVV